MGRIYSIFFFFLVSISSASAFCNSPSNTCEHIRYCFNNLTFGNLHNKWVIQHGINNNDGHIIWEGTSTCQRDFGNYKQFERDSGGCSDGEYAALGARVAAGTCGPRVTATCVENGSGHILGEIGYLCFAQTTVAQGEPCTCRTKKSGHILIQTLPGAAYIGKVHSLKSSIHKERKRSKALK